MGVPTGAKGAKGAMPAPVAAVPVAWQQQQQHQQSLRLLPRASSEQQFNSASFVGLGGGVSNKPETPRTGRSFPQAGGLTATPAAVEYVASGTGASNATPLLSRQSSIGSQTGSYAALPRKQSAVGFSSQDRAGRNSMASTTASARSLGSLTSWSSYAPSFTQRRQTSKEHLASTESLLKAYASTEAIPRAYAVPVEPPKVLAHAEVRGDRDSLTSFTRQHGSISSQSTHSALMGSIASQRSSASMPSVSTQFSSDVPERAGYSNEVVMHATAEQPHPELVIMEDHPQEQAFSENTALDGGSSTPEMLSYAPDLKSSVIYSQPAFSADATSTGGESFTQQMSCSTSEAADVLETPSFSTNRIVINPPADASMPIPAAKRGERSTSPGEHVRNNSETKTRASSFSVAFDPNAPRQSLGGAEVARAPVRNRKATSPSMSRTSMKMREDILFERKTADRSLSAGARARRPSKEAKSSTKASMSARRDSSVQRQRRTDSAGISSRQPSVDKHHSTAQPSRPRSRSASPNKSPQVVWEGCQSEKSMRAQPKKQLGAADEEALMSELKSAIAGQSVLGFNSTPYQVLNEWMASLCEPNSARGDGGSSSSPNPNKRMESKLLEDITFNQIDRAGEVAQSNVVENGRPRSVTRGGARSPRSISRQRSPSQGKQRDDSVGRNARVPKQQQRTQELVSELFGSIEMITSSLTGDSGARLRHLQELVDAMGSNRVFLRDDAKKQNQKEAKSPQSARRGLPHVKEVMTAGGTTRVFLGDQASGSMSARDWSAERRNSSNSGIRSSSASSRQRSLVAQPVRTSIGTPRERRAACGILPG